MENSGKHIFRHAATFLIVLFSNISVSVSSSSYSYTGDQNKYQFVKPSITFEKFKGLEFRLSEPYLSGTDQSFTIALELKNISEDELTRLTFRVKLFDKQGKVISESMNYCGPLTFLPASGKIIPKGYTGVYEKFASKDRSFMDSFGRIEIELTEIETAPKGMYDKPVFDPEWQTFDEFPGLEFRLSKPFQYLDAMSGNTLFAIAIEFKNKTRKPIKFLNFSQKVYDDQGLVVDREVQNHNQMYEPSEMRDEKFPAGYSGINMKFYITDLNFSSKFQRIEYKLISVDY